jgi:hypothetical protein
LPQLVERILPFVRMHAFGERLKRMLKSLDAKGMIDPETGLLVHEAFWRDLNRAVDDADKRGVACRSRASPSSAATAALASTRRAF